MYEWLSGTGESSALNVSCSRIRRAAVEAWANDVAGILSFERRARSVELRLSRFRAGASMLSIPR